MTTIGRRAADPGFSPQVAVPFHPADAAAAVGGADGGPGPRELADPPVGGGQAYRRVAAHVDGRGDTTGVESQRGVQR